MVLESQPCGCQQGCRNRGFSCLPQIWHCYSERSKLTPVQSQNSNLGIFLASIVIHLNVGSNYNRNLPEVNHSQIHHDQRWMQTKAATRHTLCWPNFTSPPHHLSSYLCFHQVATPALVGASQAGICRQQGHWWHWLHVPPHHWCAGKMLRPGSHHRGGWGGFSPNSCQGWMRQQGRADVKGTASTFPSPHRVG